MYNLGEQAVIISKNISLLLSTKYHYDQLLIGDHRQKEDLEIMKSCADIIKTCSSIIFSEVELMESTYTKYK